MQHSIFSFNSVKEYFFLNISQNKPLVLVLVSKTYIGNWLVNKLCSYFSSPPTLSFWWVELGPQVRPFFLLVDRSSFLHTALRPHVLLPSLGVTEGQEEIPHHMHCLLHRMLSDSWVFVLTSYGSQSGYDPRAGRRGGALAPLSLPLVHTGRRLDGDLMLKAFG